MDPATIRAMARGVKGIWLLMAAAVDSRIGKVWLDRMPYSLRAASGTLDEHEFVRCRHSRIRASLGPG